MADGEGRPEGLPRIFNDELTDFARDLRRLRVECGNPTLEQISKAAPRSRPLSVSALSEALKGKRLPRLDFLISLASTLVSLNSDPARPVHRDHPVVKEWRTRWAELEMLRTERLLGVPLAAPPADEEAQRILAEAELEARDIRSVAEATASKRLAEAAEAAEALKTEAERLLDETRARAASEQAEAIESAREQSAAMLAEAARTAEEVTGRASAEADALRKDAARAEVLSKAEAAARQKSESAATDRDATAQLRAEARQMRADVAVETERLLAEARRQAVAQIEEAARSAEELLVKAKADADEMRAGASEEAEQTRIAVVEEAESLVREAKQGAGALSIEQILPRTVELLGAAQDTAGKLLARIHEIDFDPTLYGMEAEYDHRGNYLYPEGFDAKASDWLPGFEQKREDWMAKYAAAQAKHEQDVQRADADLAAIKEMRDGALKLVALRQTPLCIDAGSDTRVHQLMGT